MSTPAAVSCGFCADEKFGVVFRELAVGGLQPSEFPLVLRSVQVAVARATITAELTCEGSDVAGSVMTSIEIYAGTTPPDGEIGTNPIGAWPGETLVWAASDVELMLSIAEAPRSNRYLVMFNTITILDEAGASISVPAPNTYLRVVVAIPGGGSSLACEIAGLPGPGAMGVRDDDGRISSHRDFIYSLGGAAGAGWLWNEDVMDAVGGTIDGDWAIRLSITPASPVLPDGGISLVDGGGGGDGGTGATCTSDVMCGGGERCITGRCVRISCSSPSDCGGGMTCVEGTCRNICTASAMCLGGEICDTARMVCVPASTGTEDDGGCGCRVPIGAPADRSRSLAVAIAAAAFVITRSRSRRRWRARR